MAANSFCTTGLWKLALAESQDDPFKEQRDRLRVAFLACRNKVKPVVERIAHLLPGLTIHDVSHLDALWETADLIAGTDYPLNPLEGFVLGLSFLFHDSAMCWEAYERGREGVRASVEWRDSYAHECDTSPDVSDEERRAAADFAALRALHAHQAQKIPEMSWRHPDTGEEIYLIDDAELRTEIGPLAGKIAASHHWDTESLSSALGQQFNAPFSLPSEWSVDPVKIACLLRCADAAHINQERAPLFLYALIKRRGISFQHWAAQNRMMGPSLDSGDLTNSSLIYTSSRPFKESEAEAWWIAYDAISTVSQEITLSNKLLLRRDRPSAPAFRVKRVSGIDSTDELIRYLQVDGWVPCMAKPHVSNVESLVKELGGDNLYGKGSSAHMLGVALREIIQNARDAVVARQFVDTGFRGKIVVSIGQSGNDTQLTVEDNGIGMSQRVMTGPLLDFGNSFWKSSLLQTEFPGLRSSQFKPIGRFGIGFYSIFMIAEAAEVASRAWDKGLSESNTLVFASGVSLRPILRHGRPDGLSSQMSTMVRVNVKLGLLSPDGDVLIKPNFLGAVEFSCSVKDFISAIVVGIDVPVEFISRDAAPTQIHGCDSTASQILSRISFVSNREDPSLAEYIEKNSCRLRPIQSDSRKLGMAAISTAPASRQWSLGVRTIGGLMTPLSHSESDSYVGYIDCLPQSAKRDADNFEASKESLQAWAIDQIGILETQGATDIDRLVAGSHIGSFGCDPIEFSRILVLSKEGQRIIDYKQLATFSEMMPVGILKETSMDHADTYTSVPFIDGVLLIKPIINSFACGLKMNNGEPAEKFSIIGCLHRAILNSGRTPTWQKVNVNLRSNFGQPLELLFVTST